jgi:YVTN family beta-propeller protein
MMKTSFIRSAAVVTATVAALAGAVSKASAAASAAGQLAPPWLAPAALAASADGETLFVACALANRVQVFAVAPGKVTRSIAVPAAPLGLALSQDGSRLYVTCAAPVSTVCVVNVATGQVEKRIPAGHTAMAPVLSPDGKTLYVCNRFNNDVSVIDLAAGVERRRIPVSREPVAAAITPDGRLLVVANHLYDVRTDQPGVAATVSLIDTAAGRVSKQIKLPRGSSLLRGVAVSPDGRFAAVTHLLARYYVSTTEVGAGHINANALSVLDLDRGAMLWNVPLDQADRGAANPWAVTWTADGRWVVVTHAGTHEVSLIDAPLVPQKPARVRQRLALPGRGPRAVASAGARIFVANYFSDNLCVIDPGAPGSKVAAMPLGPEQEPSAARQGEAWFNDATLCRQQWQSCASCHGAEARTDGMHWDLLNDGLGNPKKTKSLLWAHRTPPAMSMGVRGSAEAAVRAGLRHILFTDQPEAVPAAIDAYLKSLEPTPSPWLVDGKLSPAAERGRRLFQDSRVGCAECHPPPLFTDLQTFDVGTRGGYDRRPDRFDTPTLAELWRAAPYLHDGSAASVRDVLTQRNPADQHGTTSHLNDQELDDLTAYLLSL